MHIYLDVINLDPSRDSAAKRAPWGDACAASSTQGV
jgi:hypothetical protein